MNKFLPYYLLSGAIFFTLLFLPAAPAKAIVTHGDSFFRANNSGYAYIANSDFNDLDYTRDFSVEVALFIDENQVLGNWPGIITKLPYMGMYNGSIAGWGMGITNTGLFPTFFKSIQAKVGDGTNQVTVSKGDLQGKIYAVMVWDSTAKQLTLYINGKNVSSNANTNIVLDKIKNSSDLFLGLAGTRKTDETVSQGATLKENIYFARTWNRKILETELGQIYSSFTLAGTKVLPSGFNKTSLKSEWLMNESSSAAGGTGTTHLKDTNNLNNLKMANGSSLERGSGSLAATYPANGATNIPKSASLVAIGGSGSLSRTPSGPLQYYFEIDENSSFISSNKKQSGWIVSFSEYKPILKPSTKYYWRVKVRDSGGTSNESSFTQISSFTTKAAQTWYVRPKNDSSYGTGDGRSYNNAWNDVKSVKWGTEGVEAGDTLYACGTFIYSPTETNYWASQTGLTFQESGYSNEYPITVRMDCAGDEGVFWNYFLDRKGGGYDLWYPDDKGRPGVYWANISSGPTDRAIYYTGDGLLQDINGKNATLLNKVGATINNIQPGSWYSDGSKVYLRTTDSSDPTSRIYEGSVGYAFSFARRAYIKFYKCNIFGSSISTNYYGYLNEFTDVPRAHHIVIDSSNLKYRGGILVIPGMLNNDWTVRNSELSWAANGVYSLAQNYPYAEFPADRITVQNNYIHDIGDVGTGNYWHQDAHAVGVQGGDDHLIEGNYIERTSTAICTHAINEQHMNNSIIRNNFIKDIYAQDGYGGNAIALSGTSSGAPTGYRKDGQVYNNIIVRAEGGGIGSNHPDRVMFYNNLIYDTTNDTSISSMALKVYTGKYGLDVNWKNNLASNIVQNFLLVNQEGGGTNYSLQSDYNLYYPAQSLMNNGREFYYVHDGTGKYYNLSNWIARGLWDVHSFSSDPKWLNQTGDYLEPADFKPSWDSPVIDAGTNDVDSEINYDKDFYGNPIYGKRDIGPIEYQPPYTIGSDSIDKTGKIRIYADGKFRNRSQTNGTTVDLKIVPSAGYSSTDRRQWMDLDIATWEKSGTYAKSWTEESSIIDSGSVSHIVGDLAVSQNYNVYFQKQGGIKTKLATIKADTNKRISFWYNGGYSTVTFSVEATSDSITEPQGEAPDSDTGSDAGSDSDSSAGSDTSAGSGSESGSSSGSGSGVSGSESTDSELTGSGDSGTDSSSVNSGTDGSISSTGAGNGGQQGDSNDNSNGNIGTSQQSSNLYGEAPETVETVTNDEAEEVMNHNSFVRMSAEAVKIYEKLGSQLAQLAISARYRIAYFIQNSTQNTDYLGVGERGGVINSFKATYGRFPETTTDWQDVIKISNGRWPVQKNLAAEEKSKAEFKKIYLREADMNNASDNAAVTIITYGLRPARRNFDSERRGVIIFRSIYGHGPTSAADWDIVRAIAYSGAKR